MKLKQGLLRLPVIFLFLSVLCLTGTAVSAETTEEVNAYYYPEKWGEDNNAWGRPELHLKNGWYLDAKDYLPVYSVRGEAAYCIEMGVSYHSGSTRQKSDESYWDAYPSAYNRTIAPAVIKNLISALLTYGYQGEVPSGSADGEACLLEEDSVCLWFATQLLVWETVGGYRAADFSYVGPAAGEDAVIGCIRTDNPCREKILACYHNLEEKVRMHRALPSFMSAGSAAAELLWNGKEYEAVLEDRNQVISGFRFNDPAAEIRLEISGNTLYIRSAAFFADTVKLSGVKTGQKRRSVIVWGDGIMGSEDSGSQDLAVYGQEIEDPVSAVLQIMIPTGTLRIRKETTGSLPKDGWRFVIRAEDGGEILPGKTVLTAETDAGGSAEITLPAGRSYLIRESGSGRIPEQAYESIPAGEVRALCEKGKTAELTWKNRLKTAGVSITKSAESGCPGGFHFRLSGKSLSGETIVREAVSNENGKAFFTDLPLGSYTVEETDVPSYMSAPSAQSVQLVKDGENKELSFENRYKRGMIRLNKQDAAKNKLAGAVFALYGTVGSGTDILQYREECFYYLQSAETDAEGAACFADLIAAPDYRYLLVEQKAPAGLELLTEPVFIGSLPLTAEKLPETYGGVYEISAGGVSLYEAAVTAVDSPAYELPETGGPGRFRISAAGALLLLALFVPGQGKKKALLRQKRKALRRTALFLLLALTAVSGKNVQAAAGTEVLPDLSREVSLTIRRQDSEGLVYSYRKVGTIRSFPDRAEGTISAGVLHGMEDELCALLGLKAEDAVLSENGEVFFEPAVIKNALSDLLEEKPAGTRTALTEYLRRCGTAMPPVDSFGETKALKLEAGLYLVSETSVPPDITKKADPFLLALPMSSYPEISAAEKWTYDVTVYPKSRTEKPLMEKTVKTADSQEDFAHGVTASADDTILYRIEAKLTPIEDLLSYYTLLRFEDTLSEGLYYTEDPVSILWYPEGETEAEYAWQEDEGFFVLTKSGNQMCAELTEKGLAAVNPLFAGYTAEIRYSAGVKKDGSFVFGEAGNPNRAKMLYSRDPACEKLGELSDEAIVYSFGLHITKKWTDPEQESRASSGQSEAVPDLTRVGFILKNNTDGYFLAAEGGNGRYTVSGKAEAADKASVMHPAADGSLFLRGLEADEYLLCETGTDPLLKRSGEAVRLVLTAEKSEPEEFPEGKGKLSACINDIPAMLDSEGESDRAWVLLEVVNELLPPPPTEPPTEEETTAEPTTEEETSEEETGSEPAATEPETSDEPTSTAPETSEAGTEPSSVPEEGSAPDDPGTGDNWAPWLFLTGVFGMAVLCMLLLRRHVQR